MAVCDLFLCLNQGDDQINDLPYLKGEVNEALEFSEEQFKRRLDLYNENYTHIYEYYLRKGILRYIDANGSQSEVFLQVKKAIRPSITFIIGQPASGKTTLALKLNTCQNSTYINASKHKGADDFETVKKLSNEIDNVRVGTSVVVEGFPENAEQA